MSFSSVHLRTDDLISNLPSSGNARVTSFASQAAASTVDFQGGDIGYIPPSFGWFTALSFKNIHLTHRNLRPLHREHWKHCKLN